MSRFAVQVARVVRAPRVKVYRAFLDPELVARWLAPEDSIVSTATVDERVGGVHRVEMLTPSGEAHMFDSVISELVPDERIVLIFKFAPNAEETVLTVTLRDVPGGTEVVLEHRNITAEGPLNEQSVDAGWNSVLDKLEGVAHAL
ncbi:SRPBCC domain-containing protein [Solirubrobacter sp. CPCC 204708]|uniref:SRPBCC domain-containing protein n=1 Tax=Solirubrobacter deserti TaxID=2282478 RepID=A0ABT4RIU3_9ACTN|nr:SRPBCC domain-containing protein [Solirubrobacter deserti]MBE2320843.1 SRPBCC domain-containing protein [Solirubrobacter deserti]MDA0138477.1 SRPBCC domain-containing protein [Solirubrobacter deserti]